MGVICDCIRTFLWNGGPRSHALVQVQRAKGPPDASAPDINWVVSRFHPGFSLAGCSAHLHFLHCHIFDLQKQDSMNFSVQVKVMPLKELLDPQGKAVMGGLQNLGIKTIQDVRIGKTIQLQVDAGTPDEAKKIAEEASKKLLANPVMEYFEITLL